TWFGRAFVKETHREGERVRISGKVRCFGRTLQFSQPTLERADAEAVHTGRLVPIYPLTEGIKPGQMRRWLHTAIEGGTRRTGLVGEVPEPLPPAIRERHRLPDIASALRQVHFPDDVERLFAARRRLAFDELLVLQLALAQRRARWTAQASALPLSVPDAELARWIGELPFALTGAQQKSFGEIRGDLGKRVPMSRLLEGDVGSGKTVVAALAARIAAGSGAQTALMAPTELLAGQHARSLAVLFANGGPTHALLTSSVTVDPRMRAIDRLPLGSQPCVPPLRTPEQLRRVWEGVGLAVRRGQQACVVTPRIEPAEEGGDDVPSAIATEKDLEKDELRGLRLALMHGRMPAKERDAVMRRFADGEVDVLIATTVVEVGIDIPNATVMVVLGAERFGLAQLHQLRGRVGRRGQRAYCVLVSEKAEESERLAAMTERKPGTDDPLDGFDLAKRDLEIRGAGEFLGERQSGAPELRIVDLADVDPALIDDTAAEADQLLATDPQLERPEHGSL